MPLRISPFTERIVLQVVALVAILPAFFAIWCFNYASQLASTPHRPVGAVRRPAD